MELTAAGSQIGRRFYLVSALPTFLLLLYFSALLAAGAPGKPLSADLLFERIDKVSLTGISLIVAAGVGTALLLHPVQLRMVKVLEGYGWPSFWPISALARSRHEHYLRLSRDLTELANSPDDAVAALAQERLSLLPSSARLMPTRLGNALRHGEDLAGQARYGLAITRVLPLLYPLVPPTMLAQLEDSRAQVEVSVGSTWSWLLATPVSLLLLANSGAWVLLALGTFLLAWVSYLMSIDAAREYGRVMGRAVDLYRFDLLRQLRIRLPTDLADERALNADVDALLTGAVDDPAEFRFEAPAVPT